MLKSVSVSFSLPETKVGLNAERTLFEWSDSDALSILNDNNLSNTRVEPSVSPQTVTVPYDAKVIYGVFPYDAAQTSGPGGVRISIPLEQTQSVAGSLAGLHYPMAAKGEISDGVATLRFSPMVGSLALNVFKSSDYSSEEKIVGIVVTPSAVSDLAGTTTINLSDGARFSSGDSGSSALSVNLGTPAGISAQKPETSRTYENQIFVPMAKKVCSGLHITVRTTVSSYEIASEGVQLDLSAYDFLVANIDLKGGELSLDFDSSIESLTETTVNLSNGASSDNPVLLDIGTQNHDVIPDYSRAGYKYGDAEPPFVQVKRTLTENEVWVNTFAGGGTYADSTAYIQAVIDEVASAGGGAILLKEGRYNVSRTLFLDSDNLVLRGEGAGKTVLYGAGTKGWSLVYIGRSSSAKSADTDIMWSGRALSLKSLKAAGDGQEFGNYYIYSYTPRTDSYKYSNGVSIIEEYVPVGRLYVRVMDAGSFSVGDRVAIFRPFSQEWISDIGMDRIASNGPKRTITYNAGVQQWSSRETSFRRYFSRRVTAVLGDRIYLDAPVPVALDRNYGGGTIYRESISVVTGCGVEDLTIDSWFDKTKTQKMNTPSGKSGIVTYKDEAHTWKAVEVKCAEHCWIRNVDCIHMGYSLACLTTGARNISVLNCHSTEPASYISGGRRYAFAVEGNASLNLFKGCTVDKDRHGFIGNISGGLNVYVNCTGTNMPDGPEPHQGWCISDLYDNMVCLDTHIYVRDRGNSGTGHGWAGVNYTFWNCRAYSLECQNYWSRDYSPEVETNPAGYIFHSPHPSGQNWCIGCIGLKKRGTYNYKSPYFGTDPLQEDYYIDVLGIENRPDGFWYPEREVGTIGSEGDRINLNSVPADAASKPWWPKLTSGLSNFSQPYSLYECQLEDRHARGIFLNYL